MSKTILITGSTDGIGLLTAQKLAAQGHRILLHGRNGAKLAQAQETLGPGTEAYQADLSSLAGAAQLAAEVAQNHTRLDVLINNAGIFKTPEPILPDGRDIRFVVNTLAPYALTRALWGLLARDGRVINLSSAAQAPVDLAALGGEARLGDMEAYAQSKRALTLWSRGMAMQEPAGPAVIAVNPGSFLASKMVKEGFGMAGNDLGIGADILCRLALAPEFADASGRYWDNDSGDFGAIGESPAQIDAVMQLLDQMTAR